MKQIIGAIASFCVLSISFYFIWLFFQDYQFIYLFSAILIPIITMLISSQYCAGNLFALIVIGMGLLGYFYFDEPYGLVSGSVSAYMILFKLFRYGNELTGNYIDRYELKTHDHLFLNELLNSDWYQENKNKPPETVNKESLINQDFFQKHVGQIIQTLVMNKLEEFSESGYNKSNLFNLYSTGIIHTLPKPIVKTPEGIISTGTQMLLNVFANLNSINSMQSLDIENELLQILSANQLVERSANEYGIVTEEELDRIKTAKNT